MNEYKVEFSWIQDRKRVKARNWFPGDSAQEAAENCKAIFQDLGLKEGQIENVYRLTGYGWEICGNWN